MKGKAKEMFEKWLFDNDILIGWFGLTESMQWGVYVDFFDSEGIYISIDAYIYRSSGEMYFEIEVNQEWPFSKHPTRQEARAKAIEKATEMLNGRK